jgi:hypothetical protein
MALIFNSITQFEIQPERTKRRVKRDDLDTLTEIWTGPSDQEDSFIPLIGTQHPEWSLMTVIDTSIKRMPASVSEVTINYQGKFAGGGSYSSVPTISQSWMEGEVSYQSVYTTDVRVPTGSGSYYTFPQVGLNTFSRRYNGRCCQLAYITTIRPTGNPTQIGLADDFLGFTNVWETLTAFQPGASFAMQGTPIEQMVCTDVKIEDRADGWYRVTETYQSKQFPGPAVRGPVFGQIGVGTRTVDSSSPQPQPITAQNTGWLFSSSGAQGAANAAGQTLPSSDPTTQSVQVATTKQIGIDPAWGGVDNAPASAASTISYSQTQANMATPAQQLTY